MNANLTTVTSRTRETLAAKVPAVKLPSFDLPQIDLTEARKPLFAAVGVADLAVAQAKDARELPARLATVPAAVATLPTRFATVPATVAALPTRTVASALELRTTVETRAKNAQDKATEVYAGLAIRGERLVTSIRRQPATEAAIAEGKEAVKKAEAAATAARKATKAGAKAAEGAAEKLG